jgi:nucleoside-diphosphate-sugar epimerase
MSRIVVTGATGFIGRALCPVLRAAGHEIVELDRTSLGDTARFAGAQAVVHLAALAHSRGIEEGMLRKVNVELPLAVGRAAAAVGARMLFMSSVKVHGEMTEGAAFNEASPLAPQDGYASAKARAEEGLRAIPGLALTVLRPPLVYGPQVKANFLALARALARGWPLPLAGIENRRSLLYVGNLTDAVLRCLQHQAAGTFLVSDGAALTTTELCRRLGEALGRPARLFTVPRGMLELVPGATRLTRSLEVDDGALRRELGWAPPHSVDSGLQRTAEWLRAPDG